MLATVTATRGTMTELKKQGGRPAKYPEGTPLKRWIDKIYDGDFEAVAELIGVQPSTLKAYAAGHAPIPGDKGLRLKALSGGKLTLDYLMDPETFRNFEI